MNIFSTLPRKLAAILAIGVLTLGMWHVNSGNEPGATSLGQLIGNGAANAQSDDMAEALPDMFLGDEDAPITIYEYASFTCPHCGRFHKDVFPQLKANFIDTGKVRFGLREVYFDRYGLWAGMVARCGGEERYYGIVDILFSKQAEWSRHDDPNVVVEQLKLIGRQAGLDDEATQACLQDQDNAQAMVNDFQLKAGADGIESTPSFVINGDKFSNMSYSDLESILGERLN